jgi:hypothetical protein
MSTCSHFAGSYVDRGYAASTNPDVFGASTADTRFQERVDIRYFTGELARTGPTDGVLTILQTDQSNFVIRASSHEGETPQRQFEAMAYCKEGVLALGEVSGTVHGEGFIYAKPTVRSTLKQARDGSLILEQEYEAKQLDFWYQVDRFFSIYRFLPLN